MAKRSNASVRKRRGKKSKPIENPMTKVLRRIFRKSDAEKRFIYTKPLSKRTVKTEDQGPDIGQAQGHPE